MPSHTGDYNNFVMVIKNFYPLHKTFQKILLFNSFFSSPVYRFVRKTTIPLIKPGFQDFFLFFKIPLVSKTKLNQFRNLSGCIYHTDVLGSLFPPKMTNIATCRKKILKALALAMANEFCVVKQLS